MFIDDSSYDKSIRDIFKGWIDKLDGVPSSLIQLGIASDWQEAIKLLFDWKKHGIHHRFMSPYVFRGMRCLYWQLFSSLQMDYDDDVLCKQNKEMILLNNFRKYALEHKSTTYTSEWDWVVIGRHHGLPTRLIDWTGSPFVALYHAVQHAYSTYPQKRPGVNAAPKSEKSEDRKKCEHAVVWCLNIDLLHKIGQPAELKYKMEEYSGRGFTSNVLTEINIRGLKELDHLAKHCYEEMEETPITFLLDPPMIDQRIVNQHACFTVQSRLTDNRYPILSDSFIDYATRIHEKSKHYYEPNPLVKIIAIHNKAIPQIADYLEQANICPRVLYPGLEGVAETLKNRYLVPRH